MGRRRGLLLGACFTLAGLGGCRSAASGEADLLVASDGGAVVDRGADQPRAPRPVTLRIVHLGDTHAQIEPTLLPLVLPGEGGTGEKVLASSGGCARWAARLAVLRQTHPVALLLHAGDIFQGSIYFTRFLGAADRECLSLLGLDALVLGNHEFDRGPGALASFLQGVDFPVLSANAGVAAEAALTGLTRPRLVHEVDGERVAIIGLTTEETSVLSAPGAVIFADAVATARQAVQQAEAEGINKVVLLTHLGIKRDRALAEAVAGIDVIVGGHSHSLLGDFGSVGWKATGTYPLRLQGPDGAEVCLVHAWERTKVLGYLEVGFTAGGKVASCSGQPEFLVGDRFFEPGVAGGPPTPVSAAKGAILRQQALASSALAVTEEDPAALARLRPYLDEVAALRAKEIAEVTEDLWHVNVPGAVHASGASLPRGSAITPHQAEALLEQARGAGHLAQLALLNAGASRRDIRQGKLLGAQVYELLPYGNTLTLLELQGAQLRGALEAAVERATATGSSGDPFPYLGGARFTVDMNAPATQRVQAVELRTDGGIWTPLDPAATYLVATVNYLADGNDGYLLLKAAAARQNTTLVDCDCFIAYAASRGTLARLPEAWRSTFLPRR